MRYKEQVLCNSIKQLKGKTDPVSNARRDKLVRFARNLFQGVRQMAAGVIEQNLIKIKTLDRKHATQIPVVMRDQNPDSKFERIARATRPDRPGEHAKPIGWVSVETLREQLNLRGIMPSFFRYWLVEFEGNLFWFPAPRENSEAGICYKDLPQLFV